MVFQTAPLFIGGEISPDYDNKMVNISHDILARAQATRNKIVDGVEKAKKSQAKKDENIRRAILEKTRNDENITASVIAKNDELILEYIRFARVCWKRGEKSPQLLRQIMALKNKSSYHDKDYGYLYNLIYNKSAAHYHDI